MAAPLDTRRGAPAAAARVSTLELFFDLVFVFAVTQVTHLVAHAHGALDLLRAALVLVVTWWMYSAYAWLTSIVGTGETVTRLLLLAAMAEFFVMALCTPRVAGADSAAFGLAYVGVVLVHTLLFARASAASARAVVRIAPFNAAVGLLVLGAGLAAPDRPGLDGAGGLGWTGWSDGLWLAAALAALALSSVRFPAGLRLDVAHFAERHGLIILIALGESVVGLGAGVSDRPVRAPLLATAVLGLALAAGLWWSYFDRDDAAAEHALTRAPAPERARLAMFAYWHAHLLMIAGVVLAAAGVQVAVAGTAGGAGSAPAHAVLGTGTPAAAWLLAAGVAGYLAGGAAFRRLLAVGPTGARVGAAGLALATAPAGVAGGALLQLAALVALVVGLLLVEARGRGTQ